LLSYGEREQTIPEEWPDYRALGIEGEHIPDLIQMATDEALIEAEVESTEYWAPMHAWRTLGQLRAVEAVEPMLGLFDKLDEDDWAPLELPVVLGMIGPAALPALAAYLADLSHTVSSRISASNSIEEIGEWWPEGRGECIAILAEQLGRFEKSEREMNGYLVSALVLLKAREVAPVIERAFEEGAVDWIEDWDEVQIGLGLKAAKEKTTQKKAKSKRAKRPHKKR
jgi:hypothetical protein